MVTLAVIRFSEEQTPDVLEEFADASAAGIRQFLGMHTRGTGRLAASIRALVYGKHIVIESDLPYAESVDKGERFSRTMWNLINRVIPIKLQSGKVIFRKVTLESIIRGKWSVRPRPGLDYVKKGVELARSKMSLRAQLVYITQTASVS